MDPLCVLLVDQYLQITNSAVAGEFRGKYRPQDTGVVLNEVLSKWKEEELARGLVYQHLKQEAPLLATEFKDKYNCQNTGVKVKDVLFKWKEEELIRGLVYQHLKTVAPSLADEFGASHSAKFTSIEGVSDNLEYERRRRVLEIALRSYGGRKPDKKSRLGIKKRTFSKEELDRVAKAMEIGEDLKAVSKEMGRSSKSLFRKVHHLGQIGGFKTGKFSPEEIERIKVALVNNEDHKKVAVELNRLPNTVLRKIFVMKSSPTRRLTKKRISFEEDVRILDKIIPHLKFKKLSSTGFLSTLEWVALAHEMGRDYESLNNHWRRILQRWLLQHESGTTGLRIERMLTRLVAENYNDHRGIDWEQMVNQYKEFAGHTGSSLSHVYDLIRTRAKRQKSDITLHEVADYAAKAYQPGNERKESEKTFVHRQKVVNYFKEKVAKLGINVAV